MVPDMVFIKESDPFFSYKLPVGYQRFYASFPEEADEPVDQVYPFLRIGISAFGEHFEQQGKGNSLVNNAQHEYIDVRFPKLPVGAVYGKPKLILFGQKIKNKTGNKVAIQAECGNEALDTP